MRSWSECFGTSHLAALMLRSVRNFRLLRRLAPLRRRNIQPCCAKWLTRCTGCRFPPSMDSLCKWRAPLARSWVCQKVGVLPKTMSNGPCAWTRSVRSLPLTPCGRLIWRDRCPMASRKWKFKLELTRRWVVRLPFGIDVHWVMILVSRGWLWHRTVCSCSPRRAAAMRRRVLRSLTPCAKPPFH